MLIIEFEPPTTDRQPCECCGGVTTRLTRFVYRDGDAYAVYYALFSDNHPDRYVSVLVSIGEWGNDAPPSGRVAFYLRIWMGAENFQVTVRDAAESPWSNVAMFGRTLNRDEALGHPRIKEVFHISDYIVTEDAPVIQYLCREFFPAKIVPSSASLMFRHLLRAAWAPIAVLILHAVVAKTSLRTPLDFTIHLLGGASIAFFLFHAIECFPEIFGRLTRFGHGLFSFALACTVGLFWEFGELFSDTFRHTHIQHDLYETLRDLIADATGAAAALFLVLFVRWLCRKPS